MPAPDNRVADSHQIMMQAPYSKDTGMLDQVRMAAGLIKQVMDRKRMEMQSGQQAYADKVDHGPHTD